MTLSSPTALATSDVTLDDEFRLIVQGQDRRGIVAAISAAITEAGGQIVSLDQYSTDAQAGRFHQRTVVRIADLAVIRDSLESTLDRVVREELGLRWELIDSSKPKRIAIFASKTDHCLLDLLWRQRRGELPISVQMVISNHPDLADDVRSFGVPFHHVPVMAGDKAAAEAEHLGLLAGNVDLVVLARYMQIISGDFIREVGVPMINIHHSFLPAFVGSGPYKKAKERGVKLIGATAHYVTEDLDEGPIIEQDVVRVTHRASAAELAQRGADVERLVLARAVGWHCEERVLRNGTSTVVFDR
ncbi:MULTISPECIES: formyltetrahydrofolate deformylase [unclassified Rhodococcus (in: high G+C Gram-positive bacteria)]|uniref:formyltetrahydrofolate deformylase n=1 Tax=unclassified Rhodococcus (in: high G+C Gram-positive bacteria) TaxID=192944 RepID=UPI0006F522F3|nr:MULTISPECIES: formyltetrahydrofolate deformylase [unclassified Rhodococcus (in: high G+C Gram-positive bacteria)]KQU38459.1 formyltetrahydrofolate deformylase [Rhodococcus sp. Leaf225]KQU39822.1 formyltetrahydrofolate deformylase [Rhodococcus sp. Leaf258]